MSETQQYIETQHKEKEYRPVAVSIIFNNEGKVLLTKTPLENAATPWSFPQGGINDNESLSGAAKRELDEELGINDNHLETIEHAFMREEVDAEVGRIDKRGFTKGKAYIFSILSYQGDGNFLIDTDEVAEVKWATMEEAHELLNLARKEKADLLKRALVEGYKIYKH